MRYIKTTKTAPIIMVDDEDYYWLRKYFWRVRKQGNTSYAYRKAYGKYFNWNMSWDIMSRPSKGYVIDHIDGNGLNNQRYNLRLITARQNSQNKHSKRTSNYPGVYLSKHGKWIARIIVLKESFYLGSFNTELKAFEKYKSVAGDVIVPSELQPSPSLEPDEVLDEKDIERIVELMRKDGKSEEELEEALK